MSWCCCIPDTKESMKDLDIFQAGDWEKSIQDNEGCFPAIPLTFLELKLQCRNGLMSDARIYWWPYLPRITPEQQNIDTYPNFKDSASKKYQWLKKSSNNIKPIANPNYSTAKYAESNQIMTFLVDQYHIEEPGLYFPLVTIVNHFLPSVDVCFQLVSDCIARPNWYISPTAVSHNLKIYTFKQLLYRYLKDIAVQLDEIGALEPEYLNYIFVDIFHTIMPMSYVGRIMDIFLLEGYKVLHRFGLGLLYMFRDILVQHKSSITTGTIYWAELKIRCLQTFDFNELFRLSFNIGRSAYHVLTARGLARWSLGNIETEGKKNIESMRKNLKLKYRTETSGHKFEDISKLLDVESAKNLNSYIPEEYGFDGYQLAYATYKHGWNLEVMYHMTEDMWPCILLIKSLQQGVLFGAYISTPISPPSPNVVGNGLTFCFKLNGSNPNKYVWGHGRDSQRNTMANSMHQRSTMGNSMYQRNTMKSSFAPSLYRNTVTVHSAIHEESPQSEASDNQKVLTGIKETNYEDEMEFEVTVDNENAGEGKQHKNSDEDYFSQHFSEKRSLFAPFASFDLSTSQQFAIFSVDNICIGGSQQHGSNAIRIDSDLKLCSCGVTDTFGNPPLADEETNQPFAIGDIEILCGVSKTSRATSVDTYIMTKRKTELMRCKDDGLFGNTSGVAAVGRESFNTGRSSFNISGKEDSDGQGLKSPSTKRSTNQNMNSENDTDNEDVTRRTYSNNV